MSTTTTTRGAALLSDPAFAARCKFLLDGLVVGQVIRVSSCMTTEFKEDLDRDLKRFARGPSKLGSGNKTDPRTWAHAMGYDWRPVAIRICQLNGLELT